MRPLYGYKVHSRLSLFRFITFLPVCTSLQLCPHLSGCVQVSFITKVRKKKYPRRSLILVMRAQLFAPSIQVSSRTAICCISNNFSLRPRRCCSGVCLDSLPPSSQTSLFMVFLICPDGISPCAHSVQAWTRQVMMRVVPYKTNISWRKEAPVTSCLPGRRLCMWGRETEPCTCGFQ